MPAADIRGRLGEWTLIHVAVFERICSQFEDVIQQGADGHPRKHLIEHRIGESDRHLSGY